MVTVEGSLQQGSTLGVLSFPNLVVWGGGGVAAEDKRTKNKLGGAPSSQSRCCI